MGSISDLLNISKDDLTAREKDHLRKELVKSAMKSPAIKRLLATSKKRSKPVKASVRRSKPKLPAREGNVVNLRGAK